MKPKTEIPLFDQIELDTLKERTEQLEEAVLSLCADIQKMNREFVDYKKILVRIATNQQQLAERVATWPYVKVETRNRRKPDPDKSIDSDI